MSPTMAPLPLEVILILVSTAPGMAAIQCRLPLPLTGRHVNTASSKGEVFQFAGFTAVSSREAAVNPAQRRWVFSSHRCAPFRGDCQSSLDYIYTLSRIFTGLRPYFRELLPVLANLNSAAHSESLILKNKAIEFYKGKWQVEW